MAYLASSLFVIAGIAALCSLVSSFIAARAAIARLIKGSRHDDL